MTHEETERLKAADEYWTASRFVALLFGTLTVAIAFIYVISSLYSDNWVWRPLAHDPAHEILPSD
jgi:hypothetical protein